MNRVLTAPTVAAAPRALAAGPAHFDEFAQQAIEEAARAAAEEAARDAYARGRRDAEAEQNAAAERVYRQITQAIVPPVAAAADELRGLRRQRAEADADLALLIAEAVLGREPAADATELAAKVSESLSHLDEPTLTVATHPDLADDLEQLLSRHVGGSEVTVVADAACPADEARVSGRWGRAHVSRGQALDRVRAVLAEHHGAVTDGGLADVGVTDGGASAGAAATTEESADV